MPQQYLPRFLKATRGGILVFGAVVVGLAWVSYQQYAQAYRAEAHARLHAIAEMKASEVGGWRRERLADGQFFHGNRAVIELAQRILRPGGDPGATATLLDLLGRMQRNHQYSRIALHDAAGVERVASPADGVRDDGHMAEVVREAVAGGRPAFIALHAIDDEVPSMTIVASLQPGLGAILVSIDAGPALAGILKSWPVPAETAETLLAVRNGDEVMFLNTVLGPVEARDFPPIPLTRTDRTVAQAVLGESGTVEAVSRHGLEVVTAMEPVAGSEWRLVVTEGRAAVYRPLRERAAMIGIIAMLVLTGGIAVLGFVWRGHTRQLESKERELLGTLKAMAQVVEASPVVLFQWSAREGWPIEWVSANVAKWGYVPEQLLAGNPPFSAIVHPDDIDQVNQEVVRFTHEGRDSFVQEYRVRTADGRVLWVDDRTTVVRDDAGAVIRYEGTLADITERKQLQAQFVQAQKMETVGRLAGGVAHDFNNLLTVINGYAEFALMELPDDDPLREMVKEIHDAGLRAAGLTRQLLAFSRRGVVQAVSLDVNGVAEQMKKMLERLIGEDIRLTFDLEPEIWRVRADAGQLEQVIMNLAVNARDAMPKGGTLVLTTRNVSDHGDWVLLAVADTGCGMDEATQQRLFEPFFTTKAAGQGTGLGVATVYGIVTQCGGRIDVVSEVGRGSTFRLYFPRTQGDAGDVTPLSADRGLVRGTETILLVEDEESLRRIAQRILESAGYRVRCAANGPEALTILKSGEAVDLLLTDVIMPGMNGHDLAEEVRKTYPDLRVLFASGYLHDVFPDRATLGPEVAFLAKPYSPASLTSKVRAVLDWT